MSKDSNQTRKALFDATLTLIGEKGYTGTTVDEIVERAGVAKGTVYYHFKSKAELVKAIIESQPLAGLFSEAAAAHDEPAARLDALVVAELGFIADNRDFARLFITEMWREDRMWRESLLLLRDGAFGVIARTLGEGVASGAFAADLDCTVASSAIFGMVATVALDWQMHYPDRDIDSVSAETCRLVRNAVKA